MSAEAIATNYRERTPAVWRRYDVPSYCEQRHLDAIEYCGCCQRPLALIEWTRRDLAAKAHEAGLRSLALLADAANIPALVLSYAEGLEAVTIGQVLPAGGYDEVGTFSAEDLARYITRIHDRHRRVCRAIAQREENE